MSEDMYPRSDTFLWDKWANFDGTVGIDPDLDNMHRADGTPIYQPVDLQNPGWQRFTNWEDLGQWGEQLRADHEKIVYVSPDGSRVWNLIGPWCGKEGVVLDQHFSGIAHVPFEQRYVKSPYMLGEVLSRTDYRKRVINVGVLVGPTINYISKKVFPDSPFAYGMIEEAWWKDWPENHLEPAGFIGEFTRTHGWRWVRARLGEYNDQTIALSAKAFGNNCQAWAMTIHGEFPFWSKRAWVDEWENNAANALLFGRNHGELSAVNRGNWAQWPKFIVEGEGTVSIQDGITDRMVELPKIRKSDGLVLVDTDPAARTLTASTDPVDTTFYKIIRNSAILDWLLGDLTKADSGIPIGRRMPGGIGFTSQIPPESSHRIKVTHTNPNAKVTAVVSQWYKGGAS